MNAYLAEHPEVNMCSRKEIHYFAPDLYPHRDTSEAEYLRLFETGPRTKRVGEASVWYLYGSTCAQRIKSFSPDADIIIMLRNPVDMLYSLYGQWVYNGTESAESFKAAIALDDARESGSVERNVIPTSYRAAAAYTEQVDRYLRLFGRDRVRIMLYEDFADDVASEYVHTCEFLGVDPSFAPDFQVVNGGKIVRSGTAMNLLRHPPEPLRRGVSAMVPQGPKVAAWRFLLRLNRRTARRPPMTTAVRHQLEEHFSPGVASLGELIGRDLSGWTRGGAEGNSS
jgi:Sulfotransferase domain